LFSSDFLPALHLPRSALRPSAAKRLPRFAGLREMLRAMQRKCPCSAFLAHGTGGLAEGGGLFGFCCHASDCTTRYYIRLLMCYFLTYTSTPFLRLNHHNRRLSNVRSTTL